MITPIRFKAITHRGKVVSKTLKIDIPEGLRPMEYLDNIDKIQMMADNDWHGIIDYSLVVNKEKPNLMVYFDKYCGSSPHAENLKLDFSATYLRMKESLKGLSATKQFKLILSAMVVGYDASSEAYRNSTEMIKAIGDKELQKKLGWDKHPDMLNLEYKHPDLKK